MCLLTNVELSNRDTIVTVTGQHLANRTDQDVTILAIYLSEMRFIPEILYTTFKYVEEVDIEFAGVEELDPLPALPNLMFFTFIANNVTTIQNNTFSNVYATLFEVDLMFNNHEVLEVEAFAGLDNVRLLLLLLNELPQPEPGTFSPMTNLMVIDFDSNNFGFIDEELLSENRNMVGVFSERNGIDRIAPTFMANFEDLYVFYSYGNVCINRGLQDLDDQLTLAFMHNALQPCYNNFVGNDANSSRTVSFEYRGSLRLFDEFGYLILSAN